ncbi:MAG: hypothetical protein IJX41_03540 [Bacteroidaceae bacterium]|nr:hypothetical protein [Bacteroidaceae bacterium]
MRNPKQRPLNSKEEEEEIEYLKHLDRCHVEQTLIPAIISGINAGLMTKGELFDIASWKKMIYKYENRDFYFEWDKVSILQLPIYKECRIIIYKFAKPVKMPEVKYAAVIIDNIFNILYYYTLELSIGNAWVLWGKDKEHLFNYGEAKSGELKDFILWLKKNIKRNREQYNI